MARRRKASSSDLAGLGVLVVLGGVGAVGMLVLSLVASLVAATQTPQFWIFVGVIALPIATFYGYNFYWDHIFPGRYFISEEFLEQKNKIVDYVDECNELNDHIGELKSFQESIRSSNKSIGTLRDSSQYNFQRRGWSERVSGTQIHNCSKTIVTNAQNDPFKYLCKYFGIKPDEAALSDFEGMLNDFSAAEEGASHLTNKRKQLVNSILGSIHPQIKKRHWKRLERELGFDEVIFDQLSFPVYSFQYVSAGGNSSMSYDIEFYLDNIEEFVDYLGNKVKFRKSVAGQRALMTKSLRESIKERDAYQCQLCGISAHDTQNLLLEIDHIKPLAKGGITSEGNLQTLCWKCNRSKGSKDPT